MKKKIIIGLFTMGFAMNAIAQNLTFATEATYPPFESVDNSGKIVGFDVDIMNALCNQIHATCTIVNAPFDSLIPSLQVGKYDAIIAALGITPQRQQVVDFTKPYYNETVSVVASKNSELQLNATSLKGKTIGVQGNTTMYQYLKSKYGSVVKINTYQSEESAFLDLTAGRVDAVMGDTPLIEGWLQESNHSQNYSTIGRPLMDATYFGPGFGIAVQKGNSTLVNELNTALIQIKHNGTYHKIEMKWLGA